MVGHSRFEAARLAGQCFSGRSECKEERRDTAFWSRDQVVEPAGERKRFFNLWLRGNVISALTRRRRDFSSTMARGMHPSLSTRRVRNRHRVLRAPFAGFRNTTPTLDDSIRHLRVITFEGEADFIMRDEYVRAALLVIDDPNVLINVVSRRVKQLKRGNRALVESLEKLSAEDTALREIIERKISFELATPAEIAAYRG